MRETKCMEKHFCNAEQDILRQAFLPTSYIQIRKLPAQIKSGFSSHRKRGRDDMAWSADVTQQVSALAKEALTAVTGTMQPPRFSTVSKTFSSFIYIPSEYDLEKEQRVHERQEKAAKLLGPAALKTGVPTIPEKQGSFTHFTYVVDPYESKDDVWKECRGRLADMQPIKTFMPGGRGTAKDPLQLRRASQRMLKKRLLATLRADWGPRLERCFTDDKDLIICLFRLQSLPSLAGGGPDMAGSGVSFFTGGSAADVGGGAVGGDLGRDQLVSYMNQLVRSHPVACEFVLRRVATRWGLAQNGLLEFVLQPPWARLGPRDILAKVDQAPHRQPSMTASSTGSRGSVVPSTRMVVPPQTPNGTRIYSWVPPDKHLNTSIATPQSAHFSRLHARSRGEVPTEGGLGAHDGASPQ